MTQEREDRPSTPWGPLAMQPMFATASHGVLTLDFVLEHHIVLPDGTAADAGQPFALTFVVGEDAVSTEALSTVRQWCDTGESVLATSELVVTRPSLILSHDDTVVDLEFC